MPVCNASSLVLLLPCRIMPPVSLQRAYSCSSSVWCFMFRNMSCCVGTQSRLSLSLMRPLSLLPWRTYFTFIHPHIHMETSLSLTHSCCRLLVDRKLIQHSELLLSHAVSLKPKTNPPSALLGFAQEFVAAAGRSENCVSDSLCFWSFCCLCRGGSAAMTTVASKYSALLSKSKAVHDVRSFLTSLLEELVNLHPVLS